MSNQNDLELPPGTPAERLDFYRALCGVQQVAHARIDQKVTTRDVKSFGVVGDGNLGAWTGADDTTAWQAALDWQAADPKRRRLVGNDCISRVTTGLVASGDLQWDGCAVLLVRDAAVDAITIGSAGVLCRPRIRGLSVKCLPQPGQATGRGGRYGLSIQGFVAGGHIYATVVGPWIVSVRGPDSNGIEVLDAHFSSLELGNLSGASKPDVFLQIPTYSNASDIRVDCYLAGVGIDILSGTAWNNNNRWSGSLQACDVGARVPTGFMPNFTAIHFESNTVDLEIGTVFNALLGPGCSSAVTCTGAKTPLFEGQFGKITWDAATTAPTIQGGFGHAISNESPISRGNKSEIGACYVTPGNGTPVALFGAVDPPRNLWPNADFVRWITADGTANAAWGWSGGGLLTRCGDGCADTSRTTGTANGARVIQSGSSYHSDVVLVPAGTLDPLMRNCPVVVQFKLSLVSGGGPIVAIVPGAYNGTSGNDAPDYFNVPAWASGAACEDGWRLVTVAVPIDADMITSGIKARLIFGAYTEWRISEPAAFLGYNPQRQFARSSEHGTIRHLPNGKIEFDVVSIPVATTDAAYGRAFLAGDRANIAVPSAVVLGGFNTLLEGWTYSGSVWTPRHSVVSAV